MACSQNSRAGIATSAVLGFVDRQGIRKYALFGLLGVAGVSLLTVLFAIIESWWTTTFPQSAMSLGWYLAIVAVLAEAVGAAISAKGARLF